MFFSCQKKLITDKSLFVEQKYEGTLPAADCPGIKTTILLHNDKTYRLTRFYLERSQTEEVEEGTWTMDAKGIIEIFPSSKDRPSYFAVKDSSTMAMLDMDKKEITGPLEEFYILKKVK